MKMNVKQMVVCTVLIIVLICSFPILGRADTKDSVDSQTRIEDQDTQFSKNTDEEKVEQYAAQASAPSPKKVAATLRYTINNLPQQVAIQKTYIGSTYIYVIQRVGKDTYLSRCVIDESNHSANYKDHMILKNFGHAQTLEWFEHKGKAFFWVGCKANPDNTDKDWSTQIGRVQYQEPTVDANGKRTVVNKDYTQICRFSHLSYANKSGKSAGAVSRVDSALSSDKTKILFWVKCTNGVIQYSYYNAAKLNAELDKKEASSKFVPFTDSAVKAACYGAFQQTGSARVQPNNSFQGVEFSDATSIYISGGKAGQAPQIAKLTGSGSSYKYSYLRTMTHSEFGKGTEIEGLQLKGSYIYFGICDKTKTERARIFSVTKSAYTK